MLLESKRPEALSGTLRRMEAVALAGRNRSPRLFHALLEAPRALAEAATLGPALPLLLSAPKGDGHPVLVLPGYLADDASTRVLRGYLRERGYAAHGWRLGRNLGPRDDLQRRLRNRLEALRRESGQKLSLVGWSLGGVYAREMARALPRDVRQVISLGSPFRRNWVGASPEPPPVPSTAIYTRSDGVVAWSTCRERETEQTQNIEVRGSHVGLGFNPLVLYAVADRLALPDGSWQPFAPSRLRDLFYPADRN